MKYNLQDANGKGPYGVYVRQGKVGLASLHFSDAAPYISYANVPLTWRLYDG